MYAYLGYLPQAIYYFETAYKIVNQIGNKELKQNIQTHIRLAQKQLKKKGILSSAKLLGLVQFILLQIRFFYAISIKNAFIEMDALNCIADIYLGWEKWDLCIQYYQRAISIAKKQSYRLGELHASMGLLQAEISKDSDRSKSFPTNIASDLVNGFAWSTDFSVLEILLEIAPQFRTLRPLPFIWQTKMTREPA